MSETYSTTGIIMAAGSSKRFGENKILATIDGKPVISYVLEEFEKSTFVNAVIVVTSDVIKQSIKELITKAKAEKVKDIILGGKTRQESVKNALDYIKEKKLNCYYVIIHDGARPLVSYKDIDKCIQGAVKNKAVTMGIRPKDTIKQSDTAFSKSITSTIPRELLWVIQTPQAFDYELLYEAHHIAIKDKFETTDDCALVERIGTKPVIVDGDYRNIKITTPEDLSIAEVLIKN